MLAVYQYRTEMNRWAERTGPIRAWAEDDAEGHRKATGCLHEHHWDAEGANKPHPISVPDLRRVLEHYKDSRGDAKECCP